VTEGAEAEPAVPPVEPLAIPPAAKLRREHLLVAGCLLFVAFNLRTAIASPSPVLPEIRHSDGLSAPVAGLLTTLPLLCFGLVSPLAPALVRRAGVRRVLLYALCGVTIGISLRSVPPTAMLFIGTLVLGASIAVLNVQMPGIVKSRFEARTGLATGLYTGLINVGTAVSAGLTVPLTRAMGGSWRLAIGVWAVLVIGALALWTRAGSIVVPDAPAVEPSPAPRVWTSRIAWWITGYMGLQSLNYFSVLAWLPTILRDRGLSASAAGGVLSLVGVVAIPAAILAPVVANRRGNLRVAITGSTAATALGLLGLLVGAHGLEILSATVLAVGSGSSLSLALVLMVVRSEDSAHALAISGMAQGLGYLLASIGPTAVGAIEVATGGWSAPLGFLVAVAGVCWMAGWAAAADRPMGKARQS